MSQHQQNEGEHSSLLNIQYSEHQDEQNETFNDPPPMYTSQEDGLPSYQASYNEYIYKNAQEQGQGQGQLQQQQGSTSYQSFNQPVYTATTVVYHPPRVERNFDHIPSNFCGACLACWFCCLPFGCIAVIYSSQVSGAETEERAREYAEKSKVWTKRAIATGIILIIISVTLRFVVIDDY